MEMKRILFVDDEINVLMALRRMMHAHRQEFQATFLDSAHRALDLLKKQKFEAVVSDMLMPEMNGVELLKKVKEQSPDIIRFVLSGQSEQEGVLHSMDYVHQFLPKPCSDEVLLNALRSALALKDQVEGTDVKRVVSSMSQLPSMPMIYQQLLRELENPNTAMKRIGEVISQDLGLTTKVLKLVNSAYFGMTKKIANPVQAVKLLGINTVKALTLSVEVFSQFSDFDVEQFSIDMLWRQSTLIGALSRRIAQLENAEESVVDHAMIGGLLHDVGILVLGSRLQPKFKEIIQEAVQGNRNLIDVEQEKLNTHHGEIGGYLMNLWSLPDGIVKSITYHHKPIVSGTPQFTALTAVHVALGLVTKLDSSLYPVLRTELDTDYLDKIGLTRRLPIWEKQVQEHLLVGQEETEGESDEKAAPQAQP